MKRTEPEHRGKYRYWKIITTRWMDNDVYAHVNNVLYYSFFDTAVNEYLMQERVLDLSTSNPIGLVVASACEYFKPVAFPDALQAGLRVAKLGRSSVRYEIGLFRNDDPFAAAQGHFVHVYVDRITRRPLEVPPLMRTALSKIATIAADPT